MSLTPFCGMHQGCEYPRDDKEKESNGKFTSKKGNKKKRAKKSKDKKVRNRKKPQDPRTTPISIAGPLKITKADGTVTIEKASADWSKIHKTDFLANPYRKSRPKKY